jgi:hypothetical protein
LSCVVVFFFVLIKSVYLSPAASPSTKLRRAPAARILVTLG